SYIITYYYQLNIKQTKNQITPSLSPHVPRRPPPSPQPSLHNFSLQFFPPIFTTIIYQFTIFQLYKYTHSLHIHSHLQKHLRKLLQNLVSSLSLPLLLTATYILHIHTYLFQFFSHPSFISSTLGKF